MELPTSQIENLNSTEESFDFKIYMICSEQTDKVYIGSTKQTLEDRFSVHKSQAKRTDKYCRSRLLLNNFTDCRIVLIEITTKENRLVRERYWIEHYVDRAVNCQIPGRTKKQYYQQHADEYKEYNRDYYQQHIDELKEKQKEYYQQHADEYKEYNRDYYQQHIDELKEKQKGYYQQHAAEYKKYNRDYYQQHIDEIKERNKEYRSTKITCACGATIRTDSKSKHLRSKKHQDYLLSI
jgi:hypothetical protein